jgi:phosphatidate cytidylyltransferase
MCRRAPAALAERLFALRTLTAAVLLAGLVAALFWLEAAAFAALVALIVALAALEWARLAGFGPSGVWVYALACTAVYGVLAAAFHPVRSVPAGLIVIWSIALLFWLAVAPVWMARGVTIESRTWLALAGLFVLVPAALAMASLPAARLLALFGIVWIADTAAYLAGRALGRRKLAPSISPGKTWEGAAGGILGCLGYAIILAAVWPELGGRLIGPAWLAYLAAVLLLCAVSILGDLFESALKRAAGVKDSGALLPGHGGVLDRIDSATAVLPIGALLLACADAA